MHLRGTRIGTAAGKDDLSEAVVRCLQASGTQDVAQ